MNPLTPPLHRVLGHRLLRQGGSLSPHSDRQWQDGVRFAPTLRLLLKRHRRVLSCCPQLILYNITTNKIYMELSGIHSTAKYHPYDVVLI